MAGESCTWKKFYADRKHKYRTKFPFLKEDQITAKLKRIWSREKGEKHRHGSKSDWFTPHTGSSRSKKKPSCLAEPVFMPTVEAETLQTCQENVPPPQVFSDPPRLSCSCSKSQHNSSGSNSVARHNSTDIQCLDKIVQNGTNRDPQIQRAGSEDEIPALDLQDTSTYFPNASFSESPSGTDFLCDMFLPLAVKSTGSGNNPATSDQGTLAGESGYCLFLNDNDIFM